MNSRRVMLAPLMTEHRTGKNYRAGRGNVRFGSLADMCVAKRHVRFTPIADIGSAQVHVRFVPIADIMRPPRKAASSTRYFAPGL